MLSAFCPACGTPAAWLLAAEHGQEKVGENFVLFRGRPNLPSNCVPCLAPSRVPRLPELQPCSGP